MYYMTISSVKYWKVEFSYFDMAAILFFEKKIIIINILLLIKYFIFIIDSKVMNKTCLNDTIFASEWPYTRNYANIVAAILFCNFEPSTGQTQPGRQQKWIQHTQIRLEHLSNHFKHNLPTPLLYRPFFRYWHLTTPDKKHFKKV